jgi:hypothetical protein
MGRYTPRARDEIDLLLEAWARRRREVLGITHPLSASAYLGAVRCTLAERRDLHHGSRSTKVEQAWPEFPYTGDLFLVNRAIKRMNPTLGEIVDWHWTLEVPRDRRRRADLMGISRAEYYSRVARAKDFIAGALAMAQAVKEFTLESV